MFFLEKACSVHISEKISHRLLFPESYILQTLEMCRRLLRALPTWPEGSEPSFGPAAAAAKSLQSCPTLCDPIDSSPPGSLSLGFSRQEHWSGLPFPSPMQESEKWKWSVSVVRTLSDPMDCSPPGSSVRGIFQARVLEWGAIDAKLYFMKNLIQAFFLKSTHCI